MITKTINREFQLNAESETKNMKENKFVTIGGRIGHYEELEAVYDARASFYGKAKLKVYEDGGIELTSYGTTVLGKLGTDPSEIYKVDDLGPSGPSNTTKRHIREFILQYGDMSARKALKESKSFNDFYNNLPNKEDALIKEDIREYNGSSDHEDLASLGKKINSHVMDVYGFPKNVPVVCTDEFTLSATGRDYDFVGIIENNTNEPLVLSFDDNTDLEPIVIEPNEWVGLTDSAAIGAVVNHDYELNDPYVMQELGIGIYDGERD